MIVRVCVWCDLWVSRFDGVLVLSLMLCFRHFVRFWFVCSCVCIRIWMCLLCLSRVVGSCWLVTLVIISWLVYCHKFGFWSFVDFCGFGDFDLRVWWVSVF